jgi:hypothetical protein
LWHIAAFAALQKFGRYWTNNGQILILAGDGLSAFDPTATLAVHCGNGFDAGFGLYQNTCLRR